ncbi:TIR domain-containing protein [Nostocaceae cyanobacterium CENA369]|uniref:TIR domain-containing protein n=1 Tax=Dendronalium phyllosphericum CENA369 TaxID=1725256 RepID=A0A8J7I4V0_9NOST|nr:TIR domain-containing protein [Dendronalium phyllosphericum]MBH8573036.1 TIR domain-containing protein [Dendronalium phyllosphericum CENA369]
MPDSEEPEKVTNNNLQNAQFGDGLINAETVNVGQMGGNVYNIHLGQQQAAPNNTPSSPQQKERSQQERDSLEKAYTLQRQKVERIQNAWVIETDPSRKFQYEQQLQAEERTLQELGDKLLAIEQKLLELDNQQTKANTSIDVEPSPIEDKSNAIMQPGALRRNASTTQFDVFLAHNTQDKPQVRAIALALKQRNIKPWLDEEQIPPGRSFQDEIQQAIPLVKSAAIFIGSQGLGRWQSWELKAFIAECVEKKIPVIPILLPGVNNLPEDLVFLKQLRWVAFTNGVEDKAALDLLVWGITGERPESSAQLEQKPGEIPPKKVLEEVESLGIDWHQVSSSLLDEHLRLTTNPLTSGEGITYRTDQVYVPLGLVERKKQPRRKEDVTPEKGSELYHETEITQTFQHQQFLEQVLRDRQSPKSQGKRIAIIGEPGAGKTTLLQQVAKWVSKQIEQSVVIWVSLADLRSHDLESYLLEVWLQAVARKARQAEASTLVKDDFVAQFNRGLVWLVLDGVNEVQGNPLEDINRQIRQGSLLQQARIVLSCRLNLWDNGINDLLESFDNYRTLDFSYPQQVEEFICKFFSSQSPAEIQTGQQLCMALREPAKERIRDLVKNPLRLTLLCFIWYLGEGNLPQTKAQLYEQFVADFYKWEKKPSAKTREQCRRLNVALGELARDAIDKEAMRFRFRQEFVCEYLGDPDDIDSLFAIALRLGWLNKVGVEAENHRKSVYAFFHPTFQEYFAASVINDWHYFFNHIPENPSHLDANYRVFEPQWKEVLLLWLGRDPQNELDEQKEQLLNALADFEDGCSDINLYGYRADLLVAVGIGEFYHFSRTKEVIENVFRQGVHEIEIFNNPFAAAARKTLQEMNPSVLSNKLAILISSEDTIVQHDAAKLAGELRIRDLQLIDALTRLAQTTKFKDTKCYTLSSLLKLDSSNSYAIDSLIDVLNTEEYPIIAIQSLGGANIGNIKVIDALENLIKLNFFNQNKLIFMDEQDIAYFASYSLLKLDPTNNTAQLTLKVLSKQHYSDIIRSLISQSFKKHGIIGSGFETDKLEGVQKTFDEDINNKLSQIGLTLSKDIGQTINNLINIMCNNNDKNTRQKAAWCLEIILYDYLSTIPLSLCLQLVKQLKYCLNNSPDKHNTKITYLAVGVQEPMIALHKILWSISHHLPYPYFFKAWHSELSF